MQTRPKYLYMIDSNSDPIVIRAKLLHTIEFPITQTGSVLRTHYSHPPTTNTYTPSHSYPEPGRRMITNRTEHRRESSNSLRRRSKVGIIRSTSILDTHQIILLEVERPLYKSIAAGVYSRVS